MGREVKHRAWNKRKGEWVNSFFLTEDGRAVTEGQCGIECIGFDDDNIIVEQFTGLLDSKGVEIYEGDVVVGDWTEKQLRPMIVVYQAPSFVMKLKERNRTWSEFIIEASEKQLFKVIGNVHQTPSLLEEKTK